MKAPLMKAEPPSAIFVTLLGIMIVSNKAQSLKAKSSVSVTLSGISREVLFVQYINIFLSFVYNILFSEV